MPLLGIDYGRSYIGLALAETSLAEPLVIFDNNQDFLPHLTSICQQHRVEAIIIGLSEGALAAETKTFAHQVKAATNLPVIFHDETLTSHEARAKLLHAKRSLRDNPQDAYQASVMLQDYLDTHPSGQPPQS